MGGWVEEEEENDAAGPNDVNLEVAVVAEGLVGA